MENQLEIQQLQDTVAARVDQVMTELVGEKGAYAVVTVYKPENAEGANVIATGKNLTEQAAGVAALMAELFVEAMNDPDMEDKLRELIGATDDA